jgi:hypothetical protein
VTHLADLRAMLALPESERPPAYDLLTCYTRLGLARLYDGGDVAAALITRYDARDMLEAFVLVHEGLDDYQ